MNEEPSVDRLIRDLIQQGYWRRAAELRRALNEYETVRARLEEWLRLLGCDLQTKGPDVHLAIINRHLAYGPEGDDADAAFVEDFAADHDIPVDAMRAELRKSATSLSLPADVLEVGPEVRAFVSRSDFAAITRDWEHFVGLHDECVNTGVALGMLLLDAEDVLGI